MTYFGIEPVVQLNDLTEKVDPLAEVGELPHIANAVQQRNIVIRDDVAADLVDRAFAAGDHGHISEATMRAQPQRGS